MTSEPHYRLPAEWEPQQAVLLAWPHRHTDWAYMLDEVQRCYVDLAHAIVPYARLIIVAPDISVPRQALCDIDPALIDFAEIPTNDTWARDFGVITTVASDGSRRLNDYKFNGWGLKFAANLDNLITRRLTAASLLEGDYRNCLDFVLEGGSIESDGQGTILTTSECLMSPNRNGAFDRAKIEARLCRDLGAERVLWLNHGGLAGDDTDSHIDTLARLAPGDTILYVACDDPGDPHYDCLKRMEAEIHALRRADGLPYNCIGLPLPDAVYDEDGERLPATYANFLILNGAVLMPTYRQTKKDLLASQILKIAFPDHDIVTVDCSPLIRQHGSLHCVTMQIPG